MEPLPELARALRRSAELNGWRIEVVEAVVGARKGLGRMHLQGHLHGNPFASASAVAPKGDVPSVAVRQITLAQLLRPRAARFSRVLKLYAYGDLRVPWRMTP